MWRYEDWLPRSLEDVVLVVVFWLALFALAWIWKKVSRDSRLAGDLMPDVFLTLFYGTLFIGVPLWLLWRLLT